MNLIALPAFTDNPIRMLHDGRQAIDVGPGEPAPVIEARDAQQRVLAAILVTHHHVGEVDAAVRAPLAAPRPRKADSR